MDTPRSTSTTLACATCLSPGSGRQFGRTTNTSPSAPAVRLISELTAATVSHCGQRRRLSAGSDPAASSSGGARSGAGRGLVAIGSGAPDEVETAIAMDDVVAATTPKSILVAIAGEDLIASAAAPDCVGTGCSAQRLRLFEPEHEVLA